MQISNKVRRYLQIAKQKASESDYHQKHGAVLVKGGSVINVSFNNPQFSRFARRFRDNDCQATRHAEIMCVLGLAREVTEGATLYVVRINNNGNFMFSKPCDMCYEVMSFVGIKKVVYTVNNNKIKSMRVR